MANTNAEQGLNLKVASNATVRRQFAALGEALELEEVPERLECFDVSHTSGEATVASCVVFNAAGPAKSDYRRFNLKPAAAGDDYAAMAEALRRRYARVKKGEVPMPDILFVDGGKGQLAEAMTVLDELELDWLQVVAVAKGRSRRPGAEQLFLPGRKTALQLTAGFAGPVADPADSRRGTSIRDHGPQAAPREGAHDVAARGDPGAGPEKAPGAVAAVRRAAGCHRRRRRRSRESSRHQSNSGRNHIQ